MCVKLVVMFRLLEVYGGLKKKQIGGTEHCFHFQLNSLCRAGNSFAPLCSHDPSAALPTRPEPIGTQAGGTCPGFGGADLLQNEIEGGIECLACGRQKQKV